MSTARTLDQRRSDALAVLEAQGSAWLATAGVGPGTAASPHVIAVSVAWDGATLLLATKDGSPTARNLDASGHGSLVFGTPQDVVMVDATVIHSLPADAEAGPTATAFTTAMGWDPAEEGPDWRYFTLRPARIQAYRGYGELGGHVLMQDGLWRTAS